jgi:hypothetical protein
MRSGNSPQRERRSRFPSTAVFLVFWLSAGFTLGTITLLGPVRWWTEACRARGLAPYWEIGGVYLMIGILVMVSGFIARIVTNWVESAGAVARIAALVIVFASPALALWAWMNPSVLSGSMGREQKTARFVFGPYPSEARMRRLKADGYTIVSLLHPAVVPFEPKLFAEEKALAAKVGVPLIHVPMLPWVSENTEALATIKRLAADTSHRYYVHCYLGKDRVQIVRRIVEESGARTETKSLTTRRSLSQIRELERGRVYRLGAEMYLTGYPTDEEFAGYVVSGEIRQVIALLDLDDPDDRQRIDRERVLLREYELPFEVIDVDTGSYNAQKAFDAVRRVEKLPKPALVHAFFSPSSGKSPWGDGFMQTYFAHRPALPPTLFDIPLTKGKAVVITGHVALGPRPAGPDFLELARRGVVECVHVGTDRTDGDASAAGEAGLRWRNVGISSAVEVLATGGPFYVYGNQSEKVRDAVEARYRAPAKLQ